MGSGSRGSGTQGASDTDFIRFLFAGLVMPSQRGEHSLSVTKILSSLAWQGHFLLEKEKSHINYTSKLGPRPLELASILREGGDGGEVGFLYKRGVEPREKGMYVPRLVGLPIPLVSEMCMSCLIQNVCLSKTDCKAIEPQNMHNATHTHSFSQDTFIKHLLVAKHTGRHSGGKK